ncbi:UNKNOWN [Stylonychia lemnae]|uniref:Uncharacterized protein n=1 Tax=Stylonychia lemnae TaxID=5949 RepID=A0A078B383_STYLE|nr:UNKNOWN [Stylonychia lemnae]|eukprot:CDW88985.1 UNKNOWN [Stylonychia lemnae]
MFKPVQGEELSQYDPETIELYRRRPADQTYTKLLLRMPRIARNHLPVYLDKNSQLAKDIEQNNKTTPLKLLAGFVFFSWAVKQFTKIHYPYGIIYQRSRRTSWSSYVLQRAPLTVFCLGSIYLIKEYPRQFRADLTSDDEPL